MNNNTKIRSKNVLFIHHSTGGNLLKEGKVRKLLKQKNKNIKLWDHSYNLYPFMSKIIAKTGLTFHTGLSDQEGNITGVDYDIELSNNSPKEYAEIFSRDPNNSTLKEILKYDLIAFKNCYPTTRIDSNDLLEKHKKFFIKIRDNLEKYQNNKFMLVTPPPARKETTNKVQALRAKMMIEWLVSDSFLRGAKNLYIFDLFTLLADNGGYLRKEYTRSFPWDSHPNKKANQIIAPVFVYHIIKVADR